VGNFTRDNFAMDDLKVFEGRQAYDFDKGRERIITTILVNFISIFSLSIKTKTIFTLG
jgi:hypothetical protein